MQKVSFINKKKKKKKKKKLINGNAVMDHESWLPDHINLFWRM